MQSVLGLGVTNGEWKNIVQRESVQTKYIDCLSATELQEKPFQVIIFD